MEVDMKRYSSYTRNVKFFLIAAGLWPNVHPILKKTMAFVTFFSTFVIMATVSNFCIKNITNVMILTRGMGLAISFSSAFMKVCIFLLHHEDIVFLNDVLGSKYRKDLETHENRPDLLNHITAFAYFMNTHATSVAVSFSMYGIGPILALKRYGKYVRAFPSVYPFSYEPGGVIHWMLYSIEVMAAVSLWTVTVGVDCVFGVYALHMCGELRILGKKFNNLRVSDNYKKELNDCIERHHLLIKVKNTLEEIYGLISIWLAISGALVLCSLIFQVTEAAKSNASVSHLVHLCCYLLPKFLQIFTYAWYGNLIAEESGACLDSIYNSHWPEECNRRFKNDVLIVLTQEPLVLMAKGCMLIQLDMFTKIVKTSVSYFCLLRTLNEAD